MSTACGIDTQQTRPESSSIHSGGGKCSRGREGARGGRECESAREGGHLAEVFLRESVVFPDLRQEGSVVVQVDHIARIGTDAALKVSLSFLVPTTDRGEEAGVAAARSGTEG